MKQGGTSAAAVEGAVNAALAQACAVRIRGAVVFEEVGSTQDEARRIAAEGAAPGLMVLALRQTAGRGRLGRRWSDPRTMGVAATFLLRSTDASAVSLRAGLAACMCAERFVPRGSVGLKWPNDVVEMRGGRKLAGVLVEQDRGFAYAGVGLNVLQEAPDFDEAVRRRAVSLRMLGSSAGIGDVAAGLALSFDAALGMRDDEAVRAWMERDALRGTRCAFEHDGARYEGLVEAIEPTSHLVIVDDARGRVRLPALSTSVVKD